jgi:hypothetical protein
MNGALPSFPLYAFMARTRAYFTSAFLSMSLSVRIGQQLWHILSVFCFYGEAEFNDMKWVKLVVASQMLIFLKLLFIVLWINFFYFCGIC